VASVPDRASSAAPAIVVWRSKRASFREQALAGATLAGAVVKKSAGRRHRRHRAALRPPTW
jgi:hypothetical protein